MEDEVEYLWERQPDETEQAFEAFQIYRDAGLKRSNRYVCETLSKSRQLISRWKQMHNWNERVRAYDNNLEREAHKEAIKNLKDMTNRHIKISVQLQTKALEALQRMDVNDMSPRDVREYIKLATDLERLNRQTNIMQRAQDMDEDEEDGGVKVAIYMPEKDGEGD